MIKYINHLNEELNFDSNGIFLTENDLRDSSWSYLTKNNRISSFNKKISSKKVTIQIINKDKWNQLFQIMEKDVLYNIPGKLYIDDYYLNCFITEYNNSKYNKLRTYLEKKLTIVSDYPFWIKENQFQFRFENLQQVQGKNLDFSYDFSYDYFSGVNSDIVTVNSFKTVLFKLTIFGPCVNPSIVIANNPYKLNIDIIFGEKVIIDSMNKTITKIKANGEKSNIFYTRDRDYYIFEEIPNGVSNVLWNGDFDLDLQILELRSEPKWI
jgi:hypothetical protein